MTPITYVGPHDGVDVPNHATGQVVTVMRGDTADLPDAIAEGLLEQGPDHWKPAPRAKKGR